MRLIDADKLENDIAENITVKAVSRMLAITQGQPTVEAIPIEWLENWKKGKTSIEQVVADKIMMDYKYRDYWEKENETN